jgi:hypothetical protein
MDAPAASSFGIQRPSRDGASPYEYSHETQCRTADGHTAEGFLWS